MLSVIFLTISVLFILIGMYVANKVCGGVIIWVRLIIVLPLVSACFSLITIIGGDYEAYTNDILREVSLLLVYILIAVMLSGKIVLRRSTRDEKLCERKIDA